MPDKNSEKKKLMMISPMLHQGGFEKICVTTARVLEPYFDISIVIFDSADIAYNIDGLHIIDIQMGAQSGIIRKCFNIIRRSRRVKELKKQMRPDIVYSFGATANMVNSFSKTGSEKVWLGLRSYMDVEETGKIRLFARMADLIICCSKDIEKAINTKFKCSKTTVLYNLYDVQKIRAAADAKEPALSFTETVPAGKKPRYLISMGRDDDIKGFWHMLKVFSLVHRKIPESRLILVGDGSYGKYRKLARELSVDGAVCFAGLQKEPYPYLKQGEIYLLTSFHEGFPNALVEGMALSLAPVSVNCMTGPAEILIENGDTASAQRELSAKQANGEKCAIYGEYGILVPVMEKDEDLDAGRITPQEKAMAEIVTDLMLDGEKLAKYRQAAARRAELFNYESYIKQFLALAENL